MGLIKGAISFVVAAVLFFGGLALGYGIATGFKYDKLVNAVVQDAPTDDADKTDDLEVSDESKEDPVSDSNSGNSLEETLPEATEPEEG